jgi:hypothetical protein
LGVHGMMLRHEDDDGDNNHNNEILCSVKDSEFLDWLLTSQQGLCFMELVKNAILNKI